MEWLSKDRMDNQGPFSKALRRRTNKHFNMKCQIILFKALREHVGRYGPEVLKAYPQGWKETNLQLYVVAQCSLRKVTRWLKYRIRKIEKESNL